jgi:hypothetical protein
MTFIKSSLISHCICWNYNTSMNVIQFDTKKCSAFKGKMFSSNIVPISNFRYPSFSVVESYADWDMFLYELLFLNYMQVNISLWEDF